MHVRHNGDSEEVEVESGNGERDIKKERENKKKWKKITIRRRGRLGSYMYGRKRESCLKATGVIADARETWLLDFVVITSDVLLLLQHFGMRRRLLATFHISSDWRYQDEKLSSMYLSKGSNCVGSYGWVVITVVYQNTVRKKVSESGHGTITHHHCHHIMMRSLRCSS